VRPTWLACHHVVAVLVDVADDLGERLGLVLREPLCIYRSGAVARPPAPGSAAGLPQRAEDRVEIRSGIQQADVPNAVTACQREGTSELRPHRIAEIAGQPGAPVVTGPVDGADGRRHRHTGQAGHGVDADLTRVRIGHEVEADALVVEQQRIGSGVIRAQHFAVEGARVVGDRLEGSAIEHDVATDLGRPRPRRRTSSPGARYQPGSPEPRR
jgi:hypothetical protein